MQQQAATAAATVPTGKFRVLSWSPAQVDLLTRRWSEDATARQIAAELGDPAWRNAVIGKAKRLGLERRTQPGPRAGAKVVTIAKDDSIKAVPVKVVTKPKPVVCEPVVIALPGLAPWREPPPEGGVGIGELEQHHCRWIVAGEREHARYCGAFRAEGRAFAYCERHYAVAAVSVAQSKAERDVAYAMRRLG